MGKEDIIALGLLAGGAGFFLFTKTGKDMLDEYTGIDVDDFLPFNFELESLFEEDDGGGGGRRRRRDIEATSDPDLHFPIQDLYVPPNYWEINYRDDPYRKPSPEFIDWYIKGSGGYPQDQYYPPHYWWNPDYYYFFGNLQKMWYPNVYDISSVPTRRIPYWFGEVYY